MKHFGCDIGQITVQEDKEWLYHPYVMCEPSGKGRYKSQEDANQHAANAHNKEVGNPGKHVNGLNGLHLAEGLEQVVQDLWGGSAWSALPAALPLTPPPAATTRACLSEDVPPGHPSGGCGSSYPFAYLNHI